MSSPSDVAPLEATAPAEAPPAEAPPAETLPAGAEPRLVSVRGQKLGIEYPVYEGDNFIGRSDEQPVDIDLDDQELPEHIWSSRQHAKISLENGILSVEDLNSANGTYVNRGRVLPGTKQTLKVGDVIQIGSIHLMVSV